MTMTYTCVLTCGGCKATLTFTDERPAWKTYEPRVVMAEELERATRFVSEHTGEQWPEESYKHPDHPLVVAWEADGRPRFVWSEKGWPRVVELNIPPPYVYLDCLICDDRIRKPHPAPNWMY